MVRLLGEYASHIPLKPQKTGTDLNVAELNVKNDKVVPHFYLKNLGLSLFKLNAILISKKRGQTLILQSRRTRS